MVCGHCGAWNAAENQYCANCGQRLAAGLVPPDAPIDFPDAVDRRPPPPPPEVAEEAMSPEQKTRHERRVKARRAQERFVVALHFGTTMLIVVLCFIFMWYNLRIDRVLADWMDPNQPFYTFNLEREPDDFDAALRQIGESVYATTPGLTKWTEPLRLRYEGSPSVDDVVTLNQIISDFNRVEGFPGITVVDGGENVRVAFPDTNRDYWAFNTLFEGPNEDVNSYCKRLVAGGVYLRADILITPKRESQNDRNSVILHEMTHLLGFIGHSDEAESILHESARAQGLSGTDLLALQMIYNPDIPLGASYGSLETYYSEAEVEAFTPVWRAYLGPTAFEMFGEESDPDGSDGSDVDSEQLLGQQADDE